MTLRQTLQCILLSYQFPASVLHVAWSGCHFVHSKPRDYGVSIYDLLMLSASLALMCCIMARSDGIQEVSMMDSGKVVFPIVRHSDIQKNQTYFF